MIKVETNGLFHYEITGENENDAARALENALELYDRPEIFPHGGEYFNDAIAQARADISKKYGVKIAAKI